MFDAASGYILLLVWLGVESLGPLMLLGTLLKHDSLFIDKLLLRLFLHLDKFRHGLVRPWRALLLLILVRDVITISQACLLPECSILLSFPLFLLRDISNRLINDSSPLLECFQLTAQIIKVKMSTCVWIRVLFLFSLFISLFIFI